MAGRATGGRSVDRGDRPRGRPRSLHRVVLGAQARPDLVARGAPRGARADRARAAGRDRQPASSRFATWQTCWSRSPTAVRHWLHRHGIETARMKRERLGKVSARLRRRHRRPPLPAPRDDPSCAAPRRLSVRPVSSRPRRGQATSHQAAARAGSRRAVRVVRLRPVRRRAAVPSRRSATRSASRSVTRGSRAPFRRRARRRRNACSCAPTAMPRWRAGSLNFP